MELDTDLAALLVQAMQWKSEILGRDYTFEELQRDSGVSASHAFYISKGERKASREVIETLSKALAPYFPSDDAMIAAGYVPPGAEEVVLAAVTRWRQGAVDGGDATASAVRRFRPSPYIVDKMQGAWTGDAQGYARMARYIGIPVSAIEAIIQEMPVRESDLRKAGEFYRLTDEQTIGEPVEEQQASEEESAVAGNEEQQDEYQREVARRVAEKMEANGLQPADMMKVVHLNGELVDNFVRGKRMREAIVERLALWAGVPSRESATSDQWQRQVEAMLQNLSPALLAFLERLATLPTAYQDMFVQLTQNAASEVMRLHRAGETRSTDESGSGK